MFYLNIPILKGTYGIVALMVSSVINRNEGKLFTSTKNHQTRSISANGSYHSIYYSLIAKPTPIAKLEQSHDSSSDHGYISTDPEEAKLMISMTLTFLVGIIHVFRYPILD